MKAAWVTALLMLASASVLAQAAVAPGKTLAGSVAGNPARGALLVASRSQGLCGLCHALPGQPAHLQGTLGPPLAGVGGRYSADALRQHLLAPERFNPDSIMPAYGRSTGLTRVATALQGRPLLAPDQIDDVVAYLASLR